MDIFAELRKELSKQNKISSYTADKKELVIRCPYCGDSVKDRTHAHMYVATSLPYMFFCQRCEAKGILTDKVLKDLEIEDSDLNLELFKIQKVHSRNTNKTTSNISTLNLEGKLKVPKFNLESSVLQRKIEYINNRLKLDLNKNDLIKYRFIPSISQLIQLNKIKGVQSNEKLMRYIDFIDDECVAFLSADGSHLNCRFIDSSKFNGKRYSIIKLDDHNYFASKSMTFRTTLDIYAPEITLVQTEGIFDLISIYENFYKSKGLSNIAYWATAGKGFKLVPSLLNRLGFLNINLHHYSDNDISFDKYKYIFDLEKLDSVKVSYNVFTKEKDFGVPLDRIKTKTFTLKG